MAATGSEDLKLLGLWASPYVMRVKIALNLKGIEYENLEQAFGSKSELLLKSNPAYKKIPVLIHAGKPICESMISIEYIDEAWSAAGPSFLPSDLYDRAMARFWTTYLDDKAAPLLRSLRYANAEEAKTVIAEQLVPVLQQLEESFEKCSKGKDFFGGDTIGYLDIALGCYWGHIQAQEKMAGISFLDEAKVPRLVGWAQRFCSHAAVVGVMPEIDKLVEFNKMIQAMLSAQKTK